MKYPNILAAVDAAIEMREAGVSQHRGNCPLCIFYSWISRRNTYMGNCDICIASLDGGYAGCGRSMQMLFGASLLNRNACLEALRDLRQIIINEGIEA